MLPFQFPSLKFIFTKAGIIISLYFHSSLNALVPIIAVDVTCGVPPKTAGSHFTSLPILSSISTTAIVTTRPP